MSIQFQGSGNDVMQLNICTIECQTMEVPMYFYFQDSDIILTKKVPNLCAHLVNVLNVSGKDDGFQQVYADVGVAMQQVVDHNVQNLIIHVTYKKDNTQLKSVRLISGDLINTSTYPGLPDDRVNINRKGNLMT